MKNAEEFIAIQLTYCFFVQIQSVELGEGGADEILGLQELIYAFI